MELFLNDTNEDSQMRAQEKQPVEPTTPPLKEPPQKSPIKPPHKPGTPPDKLPSTPPTEIPPEQPVKPTRPPAKEGERRAGWESFKNRIQRFNRSCSFGKH